MNMNKAIYEIVVKILTEEVDASKTFLPDDNLKDIGLNSLSMIRVVVKLENEFNIEFDDEMLSFDQIITLDDLVTYISDYSKA